MCLKILDYTFLRLILRLVYQAQDVVNPNIPSKIIKKEERNSLYAQRKYWNTAINNGLELKCIYTNKFN